MSYRPHWAYRTPAGFTDEPWCQCLSAIQDLGTTLAAATTQRFFVTLEKDADYFIAAIAIGAPGTSNFSPLAYFIQDPSNNALMDQACGQTLFGQSGGIQANRGGGYCATFDPPIICRAGSVIPLDIVNLDLVNSAKFADIEFRGWKRQKSGCS